MNINLNSEKLQKAIEVATNAAVIQCIEGWEVKQIIQEKASEVLLSISVSQAIESAIATMQIDNLTQAITRELEKSIIKLATHTLRATMVNVVFDLRNGKNYMTSSQEQKEKEKIAAELE